MVISVLLSLLSRAVNEMTDWAQGFRAGKMLYCILIQIIAFLIKNYFDYNLLYFYSLYYRSTRVNCFLMFRPLEFSCVFVTVKGQNPLNPRFHQSQHFTRMEWYILSLVLLFRYQNNWQMSN